MARAKVEQQPATGTTLVVMVGLENCLPAVHGFSECRQERQHSERSQPALCRAGLLRGRGRAVSRLRRYRNRCPTSSLRRWPRGPAFSRTPAAVAHRWYEAGHPPFASIYEMLLSFVWTLAALTLIAEKRYGVKVIGTVTMPVAIVGVILMQLLPSEVRPLVPALQSTWLHVHVTLAMLAYAACALSFALAMMFLIQDKMKTEIFLAATSIFTVGIYAAVLTRFEKWGGFNVDRLGCGEQDRSVRLARRAAIRHHSRPRLADAAGLRRRGCASGAVYPGAGSRRIEGFLAIANRAVFISILLQSLALVFFLLRVRDRTDIPRSTPKACTPPAWRRAHSFSRHWSAASSPTCFICCCCGGVRISSACCPMPTRSTASPTKPFALPSPCSP